ncbi:NAD-dependent epimerase/dehydratase family protein [Ilyomonas limi]|uniref:NAD-dependent epimerase/dehydratase family protein n=1 Tax=Ilyomonas limi TaxID=2575867 RepID=A0A4U3L1Q2_9BACT|nr:NAD-dependent epimerase/dehydratase family protein [Ilyomonas limi]TKK68925.1 NAD-dependent epimerase/dehydratase family protein [Ilyomonas limi]
MVVGSGLIGKRFKNYIDDKQYLIYAAGVSNSSTKEEHAFQREVNLLQEVSINNADKKIVYFSTCSIYDNYLGKSLYVKHKLHMEKLVAAHSGGFIIFRVSNPIGFTTNHHTFFNFFIDHIKTNTPFDIWVNAERNLIDIDDMHSVCNHILRNKLFENSIVNVANPHNYSVLFIVKTLEQYLHTKATYTLTDKRSIPEIDVSAIIPIYKQLSISFTKNYLWQLLEKYFPRNAL